MARPRPFLLRQLLDLALGVLVSVAIFLVAELGLLLAGYDAGGGSTAAPRHLAAGFDPNTRVLEPDPNQPGGWRGRYSHERSKELVIPRKSSARRVLIFGGSNAAGFHRQELEKALDALGQGEFEVVNLGRAGYGSTRVAILFREAMQLLEPDVVVLYSGHNEFVEKSFAMDVEEAWDNSVVASLADALEATRFGRVLAQAFREARPSSQYTHLADWEAEYKKFSDLPWSDTIKIWSAYEENLRYMGRLAQAQGVPMLLCTPVWNRLSSPRVDTPPPGLTSEVIDQARRLHRRARKHYPAPLTELLPRKEQQRVHLFNWGGPGKVFKDGRLQEPLPELRPSLGWLADQDPKLYMEREWHPKVRAWYASLSWLYGSRTAEEEKSLHRAAKLLEEGLEILPESAILRFDMAMVRYAAGERGPDIRAAFEEAARLDRAPRKANPHSNERVHRVAAELEGVHLFDADKRFAEGSPDGLVGWEWMTDHCHLSHGAGGALLRDIADEVAGLVQGDPR